MRELSTVQTPSNIIAFLTPCPAPNLEDVVNEAEMLVVLDRLHDPGNIGTIMRTSEAMGVSAVILLKDCCNPNNHKVIRAAMGSSFRLPVVANVDVQSLFQILNKNGYMTICADMQGEILNNFKFAEKSALFMGQEGKGLSDFIIKNCKSRVAIPIPCCRPWSRPFPRPARWCRRSARRRSWALPSAAWQPGRCPWRFPPPRIRSAAWRPV